MSKDAHYARLNARFDGRATYLRGKGFVYKAVEGLEGVAIFTRKDWRFRDCNIPASFVMCADEIVWQDRVDDIERDFPVK